MHGIAIYYYYLCEQPSCNSDGLKYYIVVITLS
jgi:hypothetical protein